MKPDSRSLDLLLTAVAPAVWGSTYIVTTEMLAGWHPLVLALLRALPAGLLLLVLVRQLPRGIWWWRSLLLGALNFSVFWVLLFVSAYRLPGGVAATVGAIQPLIVVLLAHFVLGAPVRAVAVLAGCGGIVGVAMLVLTPGATLDPLGIAAGLGGAVSMAFGTVLTRRWQPQVSALTFTAWQLAAGGALLLPVVIWMQPPVPAVSALNLLGLAWLGLVGAALTYILWFRGIARLGPNAAAPLALLSPVVAALLGWWWLGQTLTAVQLGGVVAVIVSIALSQVAQARPSARQPLGRRSHPMRRSV